jgi:TetR/AcrR family transcriptional regulator
MSRTGGEERRRLILHLALESFAFRGHRATTLDDVAAAAGVRKQTLLYYFPSKEHLFRACVREFGAHVAGTIEPVLDGPHTGWDRVEQVIRAVFRMTEKRPDLVFFANEAASASPQVVQRVARVLDPLRRRALAHLEEGMRLGVFRRQDPRLLLFTLYTAVVSSVTEAGVLGGVFGLSKGRVTLRHREEQLVEFVRRALAVDQRRKPALAAPARSRRRSRARLTPRRRSRRVG